MIQQIRNLALKTLRDLGELANKKSDKIDLDDFIFLLQKNAPAHGIESTPKTNSEKQIFSLKSVIATMQKVLKSLLPKSLTDRHATLFEENMTKNLATSEILREKWSAFASAKVHHSVLAKMADVVVAFLSNTLNEKGSGETARIREIIAMLKRYPESVVDSAVIAEVEQIAKLLLIKNMGLDSPIKERVIEPVKSVESADFSAESAADSAVQSAPKTAILSAESAENERDTLTQLCPIAHLLKIMEKREMDYFVGIFSIKELKEIAAKHGAHIADKILYITAKTLQALSGDENVSQSESKNAFVALLFEQESRLSARLASIKEQVENNIFMIKDEKITTTLSITTLRRSDFATLGALKDALLKITQGE